MTAQGKVVAFGRGRGTEFHIGADRFLTKGTAAERSDSFAVIEYEAAPGQPGPPPHVHRTFDEAWYILDEEVTFTSNGRSVDANRGTYLFVPRKVAHSFRVAGDRPARWLGIFSPGRFVGLVEELGPLIPALGPPDPVAVSRIFAKYDSEIVATTD